MFWSQIENRRWELEIMKNTKILPAFIVDDDSFWTLVLKQILTEHGLSKIHTFEDGEDCLNHIHLNPDWIFLDYHFSH